MVAEKWLTSCITHKKAVTLRTFRLDAHSYTMATAIEFNHVSKQYRLGLVSTHTLSHDLDRWFQTAILRREDPYLKIGEVNDRASKGTSEYVWALRDIDFKVEQGDVVGIIGKNGAGKSTLLKLLSKVTAPTTGTIRARGRIASLLEVGTGFHQEMTGRENIYMNGAILGMTKQEITSKLDEIVAFSGCERYLDTPVKRYSSGMMVRLGFAVAAHLDPEILVVDEVLAVGDAEFQKKAIGKMQDISHGEGRTVLFVSHNMAAVSRLCKSCVLLANGTISALGNSKEIVHRYLQDSTKKSSCSYYADKVSDVYCKFAQLHNSENKVTDIFKQSGDLFLDLQLVNGSEQLIQCSIALYNVDNTLIMVHRFPLNPQEQYMSCSFYLPLSYLAPGKYMISVALYIPNFKVFDIQKECLSFSSIDTNGLAVTQNGDVDNGFMMSLWRQCE